MSEELRRESSEFDEHLFGSINDIDEHLKKSKTLMSEDSGIGIGAASPYDDNPYLLNGGCCKMTRSAGIHSGLSEHTKPERTGEAKVEKFTSAFGQYLALAERLHDSSLDSSTASSDDDCFVEDNNSVVEEESSICQREVQVGADDKENCNQDFQKESVIFHRGLKCEDVDSALKILKTRFLLNDINIKRHHDKLVESSYPEPATKFIDSCVWRPQMSETPVTIKLREVKEEIELRNREIEGITKLILKRHQDVLDEEKRMTEVKKLKHDTSTPKRDYPKTPVRPSDVGLIARRKLKNPFGRAFQTVKKFIVRRDKMARA